MPDPRDRFSPSFSFGRPGKRDSSPPRASTPPPQPQRQQAASAPPVAPAPVAADAPRVSVRMWAGAGKGTFAVAFTDIVSSSALTNKLGNHEMDLLRKKHFTWASELVKRHGGCVVKTIGDSVMAVFRAAADALDFALAIHEEPGDRRIQVRAGIHVGPVSVDDGDVYGTTVNYAARVASSAAGADVRLSSEAKSHVEQEGDPRHAALRYAPLRDQEMKGFPGKHILWEVGGAE